MEVASPLADIRARNASLHSRGKTENGTLYLTRHHLIFSYVPNSRHDRDAHSNPSGVASRAASGAHAPSLSALASKLSIASTSEDTHVANPSPDATEGVHRHDKPAPDRKSDESAGQSTSFPSKARPKEIWVPYPMINHCVLRPSHASSWQLRPQDQESRSDATEGSDEAFPPVFGTGAYTRPSTDSAHHPPYLSPQRAASPAPVSGSAGMTNESGRSPALRLRRRDFGMMAFHFHASASDKSPDEWAREIFYSLRSRCCVESASHLHAFHFKPPEEETSAGCLPYDATREFARMGIGGKAAETPPGNAWRISDINHDYAFSKTYPHVLCVPRAVSDNMLKYGGPFRSKSRIPALTYLHPNGGSITRSSQPMVGVQGKRNPQDERLVTAIFSSQNPLHSSHDPTAQTSALSTALPTIVEPDTLSSEAKDSAAPQSSSDADDDSSAGPCPKVYGSTRRTLIADARPRINMFANRAMGGGIEDAANYTGLNGVPVEKVFLDIANIHAMRSSLDKVVDSLANSDYLDMRPNQELLRKSGWLSHIAGLLDGADMIAKVVGLGGSHVLIHCSDGWDRTSQVAALAEIMLDPYYRTLDGFMTLVQKDFFSFGHKFQHRHGILGSEKWFDIENERVVPSRPKQAPEVNPNSINTFSSKALLGAKSWLEKNRTSLFRPQNGARSSLDGSESPASSPSPNSVLHSPPTASSTQDKEHRMDEKEISPIFHQFLDAVFQLQHQDPTAFEFNERFLRRLFYHAYSGQYGEFLFNTESERVAHAGQTHSIWPHFLSRRQEFGNPEYAAKIGDPLLLPVRQPLDREIEVRWWSGLFGRKDEEMNTPRSLAPPDPERSPRLSVHPSAVSLDDGLTLSNGRLVDDTPSAYRMKGAKSNPDFGTMQSVPPRLSARLKDDEDARSAPHAVQSETRPTLEQRDTDEAMLDRYTRPQQPAPSSDGPGATLAKPAAGDAGDPLGVSGGDVPTVQTSRLDFAAFAKQSAYSER